MRIIDVTEVFQVNDNNKNIASIVCNIPKYKNILKRIEIGESITTKPFDIEFPDFSSKWIIIFYPKGQYEFGLPSENCRAYIKCVFPFDKHIFKMSIRISMQSSTANSEAEMLTYKFILGDKKRHWAGPMQMETIKEYELNDNLTIQCLFEVIRSENNFSFKRRFDDLNSTLKNEPLRFQMTSKKNRTVSPKTENTNLPALEKKELPKPTFSYKQPRKLLFSPEERAEVKEMYKSKPTSRRISTLELKDKMNNVLSPTFKSSKCLSVSDIFRNDPVGMEENQDTCVDKNEKKSVADVVDGDGNQRELTRKKRIDFLLRKNDPSY